MIKYLAEYMSYHQTASHDKIISLKFQSSRFMHGSRYIQLNLSPESAKLLRHRGEG